MELRSSGKKSNFNELKAALSGMGVYENGMELEEMRDLLSAIQESMTSSNEDTDYARAICLTLKEEEKRRQGEKGYDHAGIDFWHGGSNMLNSTMQSDIQLSPVSSDSWRSKSEAHSVVITTMAEVHHPIDWSPTRDLHEKNEKILKLSNAANRRTANIPSPSSGISYEYLSKRRHIIDYEINGDLESELSCSLGMSSSSSHNDSGINLSSAPMRGESNIGEFCNMQMEISSDTESQAHTEFVYDDNHRSQKSCR